MPYDGKLLARAREALEQQKQANQNEQQRRLKEVSARAPQLDTISFGLRRQMAELARLSLSHSADLSERLAALQRENLELQAQRLEFLRSLGLPENYLDEIISCSICRDSGMDGNQPCRCLKKYYNQALTAELGTLLRHGDESFERFDLTLYDETPLPGDSVSPRFAMEQILRQCRKFADNFPAVSSNLLFQGGNGLGKTYLSACIARVVAEKGYSVCYESASAALEAYETQKFTRDEEAAAAAAQRVRGMEDCDLMILDDLGTELITAVSMSALYTLINKRLIAGKKTIISTNLSDEELQRRYSAQICSRIRGEFLRLHFIGRDIRLMKK